MGILFSRYLDDHGDSFGGATLRDLRKYAGEVPAGTRVTSTGDAVTISVPSQSGNAFRMRQELRGGEIQVKQDCRVPGVAGCPADGDW